METQQLGQLLGKLSVRRPIRRKSDMQFQNYHLEDLGSGESEDVSLAFAPRQTLVQRSPSEERMDEWLYLPHVSAQPGDFCSSLLGVPRRPAILAHRGVLERLCIVEAERLVHGRNNNRQSSGDCGRSCPWPLEGCEGHCSADLLAYMVRAQRLHIQRETGKRKAHH